MIAAVTGGTGFIGRHLVRRLVADGATVRCLVRATSGEVETGSERHVVRFDDADTVRQCGALDGVDVVFHLAAATKAHGWGEFHAANVVPAVSLLEALVARRTACRFVFVSSQAAAGPATAREAPTTEIDAPHPVEAYGLSKLEAERVVASYGDRLSATIVRPCAVFGPGDQDFLTLFRLAGRGLVVYPGTADHWLSLLFVEDVVEGILAASREGKAGRIYFLSSTAPIQWRTFGDHIAEAAGVPVRHLNVFGPAVQAASVAGEWIGRLTRRVTLANRSKAALARYPYWVCSGDRARTELGFTESRSLPVAVRDTYLWYLQSGWMRRAHRTA
ncbi:MAG TPA: NAD-dependent epimerase/dehydratase family protein [Gemmatimonadaceae bacterium]|nr:NAD-dependent epimerase/dehydratase family protein [Gemmatimonadaceae bacterium]